MRVSQQNYVTKKSETCTAISEWIQATQEFHRYYNRIGELLQDRQFNNYAGLADRSRRINTLGKLRQHMNHVLETLLTDMDTEGSPAVKKINNVSKAGKLITHARLLKQINQKISQELVQFTAFQA